MENNTTDSGSRVTRSLRKRLESVDSDSTSRPGTPISSKLTLISEISSPSKLTRMTRRNSTSGIATPTKTPAKRAVATSAIAENLDTPTPTRTRSRRRSISAQENEESLTRIQIQKFPPVDEEVPLNTLKSTIVTRSQSKSPQQEDNTLKISSPKKIRSKSKEIQVENIKVDISKKRKAGPKSKTRQHDESEDVSDVEICVFENETEDTENISSNIKTMVLTDEEPSRLSSKDKEPENEQLEKNVDLVLSSHTSNFIEGGILNVNELQIDKGHVNAKQKNSPTSIHKISEESQKDTTSSSSTTLSESMEIMNLDEHKDHIPEHSVENKIINAEEPNLPENQINLSVSEAVEFNKDIEDITTKDIEDIKKYCTAQVAQEKIFETENVDDVTNKCTTPNAKPLHSENIEILSTSTLNRSLCKIVMKKVDFVSSLTSDNSAKNIYPKTPVSRKTANSFKENRSPQEDLETNLETETLNVESELDSMDEKLTPERSLKPSNTLEIDTESVEKNDFSSMENDKEELLPNKSLLELNISLNEGIKENEESKILINIISEENNDDISSSSNPKDLFSAEEAKSELLPNKSINELDGSIVHDEGIKESDETKISTNIISEKNNVDISSCFNQNFPSEPPTIADDSNFNSDIQQNNTSNNNCCDEDNVPKQKQTETGQVRSITPSPENEEIGKTDEDNFKEEEEEEEEVPQKAELHEQVNENETSKMSANIMPENELLNELKWTNPSVKGTTADGTKIDAVVVSQYNFSSTNNCCDADNVPKQIQNDQKLRITPSSEYEEEDENEEQEQSDGDDDGDGESYKLKHDFIDDEAVEVNEYQSGDSLDSEERRDIEENEIPVDGESIGNETTDEDENGEEEVIEDDDSFIVSDSEDPRYHESDDEEEEFAEEEANNEKRNQNKKIYKRVQRLAESSSTSSDEETEKDEKLKDGYRNNLNNDNKCDTVERHNENANENVTEAKSINGSPIVEQNNLLTKSRESIVLNSSKLSDSAFRLHCSGNSEGGEDNNAEEINKSSKEFLRNLNQLDRFNKSIRDLTTEVDASPIENSETETHQYINTETETETTITSTSTSPDEKHEKSLNRENSQHEERESDSGERAVTSESDANKENENKSLLLKKDKKSESGLSISVHNYREQTAREGRQRSFTIDVTVKDGEIETDVKLNESVSSSSTSNYYQENENESEGIKHLESSRKIPLRFGNRLIRTRRQSLILPANPDAQICADVGAIARKLNRNSLGVFSSNDFKPSQSFIDSIELQKREGHRLVPKRKRLSKSFCGASETHDNSIIDIDERHLHKRSKLMSKNSTEESRESIENINSSKRFTKNSSTPYEKINKPDSFSHQRILARCDEILEAANRAKLEAKIKNKKNKVSKKQSKKKSVLTSSGDINIEEDNLRRISKEIKRKDKTKTALSHAIMAASDILSNKEKPYRNKEAQEEPEVKQLPADVIIEAVENSVSTNKKLKKEMIHKQGKIKDVPITATSAGSFMELPKSPERKMKKSTYIQLSTGKVSVELITPKKRSVKAFNGTEFRESPVTPSAVGFKVRKISPSDHNVSSSTGLKTRKRKRYDEYFKDYTTSKAQWTQSGFFKEEEISKSNQCVSHKTKNRQIERQAHVANRNFKEKSIMRSDIQRSTKRDLLRLKERRQV